MRIGAGAIVGTTIYLSPFRTQDSIGKLDATNEQFSTVSIANHPDVAGLNGGHKYPAATALGTTVYFPPFAEDAQRSNVGVLDPQPTPSQWSR